VPILHRKFIFLKKDQNLNFWWYFKFPQANCFWAILGRFYCIDSG
jgi:hypothetical protein